MGILKVLKLSPGAHEPTRANPGDLGYDLYALERTVIRKGATATVRTGIALQPPPGWGGLIKDRSSMALRRITVSGGVIDHGYRGEIVVILTNGSGGDIVLEAGDKIAQFVPVPVTEWRISVESAIDSSQRGENGFGSSGAGKGEAEARVVSR